MCVVVTTFGRMLSVCSDRGREGGVNPGSLLLASHKLMVTAFRGHEEDSDAQLETVEKASILTRHNISLVQFEDS